MSFKLYFQLKKGLSWIFLPQFDLLPHKKQILATLFVWISGNFLLSFYLCYREARRIIRHSFINSRANDDVWHDLFLSSAKVLQSHFFWIALPMAVMALLLLASFVSTFNRKERRENRHNVILLGFRELTIVNIINVLALFWAIGFIPYFEFGVSLFVLLVKLPIFVILFVQFRWMLAVVFRDKIHLWPTVTLAVMSLAFIALLIPLNQLYFRLYPDLHIFLTWQFFTWTGFLFALLFTFALQKFDGVYLILASVLVGSLSLASIYLLFQAKAHQHQASTKSFMMVNGRFAIPYLQQDRIDYIPQKCSIENKTNFEQLAQDFSVNSLIDPSIFPKPKDKNLNFIVITMDAVRADRFYKKKYRKLAPWLKQKMADHIHFKHSYAPSSYTIGSLMSMISLGQLSFVEGKIFKGMAARGQLFPSQKTVFKEFKKAGYDTSLFVSKISKKHIRKGNNFHLGVNHLYLRGDKLDKKLIKRAKERLDNNLKNKKPFFQWIHTGQSHGPYNHWKFGKKPVNRYNASIDANDDLIQKLLSDWDSLKDNTVIFITSDHGEEFREHFGSFHKTTLYEEVIHVPAIVILPQALAQNKTIVKTTSVIDILAALVDRYSPVDVNTIIPHGYKVWKMAAPGVVITELITEHSILASLTASNSKLIYDYYQDSWQLFDLKRDRRERKNLIGLPKSRRLQSKMKKSLMLLDQIKGCYGKMSIQ